MAIISTDHTLKFRSYTEGSFERLSIQKSYSHMKSIELYINGQLCDLGNPTDFSVFLKRQFINPTEMGTKDTQRSYDIILPTSARNNEILRHVNIEEVKNKFSTMYDALLIIGGIKIFEGKFKLNEITTDEYRGNLGTPSRAVKDIFGDMNMNETGKWEIPFNGVSDINRYNKMESPDFFFPLVMYGLLPKNPTNGLYSAKNRIDSTVRIGIENLPPSIKCLTMLNRIFANKGLKLSGTAFADERLSKLYVSYKNPSEYAMPWNYGDLGKMRIKGLWTNGIIDKNGGPTQWENNVSLSAHPIHESGSVFSANILNAKFAKHRYKDIPGGSEEDKLGWTKYNVKDWKHTDVKDGYKYWGDYISAQKNKDRYYYSIQIPQSGYYKVELDGNLFIPSNHENSGKVEPFVGYTFGNFKTSANDLDYSAANEREGKYDKFTDAARYELKLIRDRGTANFDLNTGIDGTYFKKNYDQDWYIYNSKGTEKPASTRASYFPILDEKTKQNKDQILFVDPAQNKNLVVGFCWGRYRDYANDRSDHWLQHILDDTSVKKSGVLTEDYGENALWATVLAAKSSYSWDHEQEKDPKVRSRVLVHNPRGYAKYVIYNPDLPSEEQEPEVTPGEITETEDLKPQLMADSNADKNAPGQLISSFIDNYKMQLLESSSSSKPRGSYAKRGFYKGIGRKEYPQTLHTNQCADGKVQAIVWFEKGERLTLVSSTDYGRGTTSWIWHMMEFDLKITPYRIDKGYGMFDEYTGKALTEKFYWDDNVQSEYLFYKDKIDLIKFLPSNIKVDDWISNFCKAFNLNIIQTKDNEFELNVRKGNNLDSSLLIDLDSKANVSVIRKNIPLGLPGEFHFGFTTNKDETGYYNTTMRFNADGTPERNPLDDSIKEYPAENGSGIFRTGSVDTGKVEHKSSFSYNWMLKLNGDESHPKVELPIISDKEAWQLDNGDYAEMMRKTYYDKAQRFWYKKNGTYSMLLNQTHNLEVGLVRNTQSGAYPLVLDYKDMPNSIASSYFPMLKDAENSYTVVECFITPEEYANADHSLVKFNGDMYYIAEIDGYDPQNEKKATVKLIRKML